MFEILDENDNVINRIVADESFVESVYPGRWRAVAAEPQPDIPPAPPQVTTITPLEFLERFTDEEAIAIDLASIGTTQLAASVRRLMQLINAARTIELDNPRTISGVQQLEAAGLIATGRAAEILSTT